jgi:hypothetical protein
MPPTVTTTTTVGGWLRRKLAAARNVRDGAKALTVLVAKRPRRKAFENFMVGLLASWVVVKTTTTRA